MLFGFRIARCQKAQQRTKSYIITEELRDFCKLNQSLAGSIKAFVKQTIIYSCHIPWYLMILLDPLNLRIKSLAESAGNCAEHSRILDIVLGLKQAVEIAADHDRMCKL